MAGEQENLSGFNRPRSIEDPDVVRQYQELGIGSTPSMQDIEPYAIAMMRERKIFEGISLVLGREIDTENAEQDAALRDITLLAIQDPEQAFGLLLLKLAVDEAKEEPSR